MKTKNGKLAIVLVFCMLLCAAAVASAYIALESSAPQEQETGFVPPPFEAEAAVGVPEVPDELGYSPIQTPAFTAYVCGNVQVQKGVARVYFTNDSENSVWLKIRISDSKDNILGESGLLKPGEYVSGVTLKPTPDAGEALNMKIMAYEPDTYHSAGSAVLSTISGEGE